MEMPVEKKPTKTGAIIGTIAAVLLCGCPGLASLCYGLVFATGGLFPGSTSTSSGPLATLATGLALVCAGAVFVIIPVAVGILTLRRRPLEVNPKYANEEIPPAI